MDKIIKKRQELANYFFNLDKHYTKTIVLNKEFAVLSFSPKEEYIDAITTTFDHILTDFNEVEISNSDEEFYVKGVVVDIDHKKEYSIIHIQNKSDMLSVSLGGNVLTKYGDKLEKGQPIFVKGHYYNEKFYMHFMIDLLNQQEYQKEINFVTGRSIDKLKSKDLHSISKGQDYALVSQATYFTSQNGNKCIRMQVYSTVEDDNVVRITCSNKYNDLPYNIVNAGDIIFYEMSGDSDVFCNKVQVIE